MMLNATKSIFTKWENECRSIKDLVQSEAKQAQRTVISQSTPIAGILCSRFLLFHVTNQLFSGRRMELQTEHNKAAATEAESGTKFLRQYLE